jgi:hypothetical protein
MDFVVIAHWCGPMLTHPALTKVDPLCGSLNSNRRVGVLGG